MEKLKAAAAATIAAEEIEGYYFLSATSTDDIDTIHLALLQSDIPMQGGATSYPPAPSSSSSSLSSYSLNTDSSTNTVSSFSSSLLFNDVKWEGKLYCPLSIFHFCLSSSLFSLHAAREIVGDFLNFHKIFIASRFNEQDQSYLCLLFDGFNFSKFNINFFSFQDHHQDHHQEIIIEWNRLRGYSPLMSQYYKSMEEHFDNIKSKTALNTSFQKPNVFNDIPAEAISYGAILTSLCLEEPKPEPDCLPCLNISEQINILLEEVKQFIESQSSYELLNEHGACLLTNFAESLLISMNIIAGNSSQSSNNNNSSNRSSSRSSSNSSSSNSSNSSNSSGSGSSSNSNSSKSDSNSSNSNSDTNNSSSKDAVLKNVAVSKSKKDIDSTAAIEELLKVAERVFLICFKKYDHLPDQLFAASRREEWQLLQLHFKHLHDRIKGHHSNVANKSMNKESFAKL